MDNLNKEEEIRKNKYIVLTGVIISIFLLFISFYNIFFIYNGKEGENSDVSNHKEILKKDCDIITTSKEKIIILGEKEKVSTEIIKNQLINSKENYGIYDKVSQIEGDLSNSQIIIIDGSELKTIASKEELNTLLDKGVHIIFSSLPDRSIIENYDLKEVMGIDKIDENVSQKGIRFLDGFMLGGLMEYEDFNYDVPYVTPSSTTKVFVCGIVEEEDKSNEELPPLIWRNVYKGSKIFIVNGPFFESNVGYGILSSIVSQIHEDYIYPIVNANAITINGFPSFSDENKDKLEELYGMNQALLQQDVIFPTLLSLCEKNKLTLSCFLTDKYTASSTVNMNLRAFNNYKNEILKMGGEIGVSALNDINEGINVFNNKLEAMEIKSILAKNKSRTELTEVVNKNKGLSSVEAIVGSWEDGQATTEFLTDKAVFIPITMDGINISDEDMLSFYSAVTSMGLIVQNLDLKDIIYPKSEDYDWVKVSKEYGNYINSYRYKFHMIESENINETGYKIKNFILCNPEINYEENKISIKNEKQVSDNYYILRTEKKVESISSGEVTKIEDDVYLIKTSTKEVDIKLKYSEEWKY